MRYNSNIEGLKQEYLEIFEGVKSNIMHGTQYDENSDIGTTYLGLR